MKNSPLITALLVIVTACALASLVLCYLCVSNTRELSELQQQGLQDQANLNRMQALISDTVEYGRSNPSINPVLEAAGIRQRSNPGSVNKPAAR